MNPVFSPSGLPQASAAVPASALRVVAMGGGTGLSALLRGLRSHVTVAGQAQAIAPQIADLAAVVTVTDDGGSSGRLREEFNMLPPGDLRNCMVALSEEEDLLSRLFSHRFRSDNSLKGHTLGNLFLAALMEITDDFALAIQLSSKILATRGRIYPATLANTTLVALMDDGSLVRGETKITASRRRIVELMLDPPSPAPLPETLDAMERADLITVGPGSLYTSLITNLLVDGIAETLQKARGLRVYVCNLMTQANESIGLTAAEHIEKIYNHTGAPVFDCALVNIAPFSPETVARYAAENAAPIEADIERIEALGVRVVTGNFALESPLVRHHGPRVTDALLALGRAHHQR